MTRADFLKLVKMDAEALKSIARRSQLPFRSDDEGRRLGEYTEMEAFLLILATDLAGDPGINRTTAANIVQSFAMSLYRWWPEIGATARALVGGRGADDEVLCGRMWLSGSGQPVPFCAPASMLGTILEQHKPVVRIVATSASRGMAVLMRRADWAGLEVPPDLFKFRYDHDTSPDAT